MRVGVKTGLTEVETEMIYALRHELIDGVEIVPYKLLPIHTREVLLTEFSARLVDPKPLQLLSSTLRQSRRRQRRDRNRNLAEEHSEWY
jgi:hypothetical protein